MTRLPLTTQPIALAFIWLCAICGAIAVILGSGLVLEGVLAVAAGVSLAILLHLANSSSPGGRAAGSILTIVVGIFLTGAIGLAIVTGILAEELLSPLGITIALILTAWGAAGAATTGLAPAATRDALYMLMITAVPVALYLIYLVQTVDDFQPDETESISRADSVPIDYVGDVVELLISPDADFVGVLSFFVLVFAVLLTIWYTAPRLTIFSLLHRSKRVPIESSLNTLRAYSNLAIVYGVFTILVGGAAFIAITFVRLSIPELQTDIDSLLDQVEGILFAVGGSDELRWLMLSVAGIFWLGWAVSSIPAVPRIRHHPLVDWFPTIIGGFGVVVAIHAGYPVLYERIIEPELQQSDSGHYIELGFLPGEFITVEELSFILDPPIGQSVAAVAIIVILGLVFCFIATITLLKRVGIIRDRGATGSIAGSALIGASLFMGIDGASVLLIGVPLVFGIAIWDLTRFADSLVSELGSAPTTVAPILVHGTSTIVVGMVLLSLVIIIEYRPIEIEPALTAPVIGLLALGLVLYFIALKQRSNRMAS